jgi:hypothetical protein
LEDILQKYLIDQRHPLAVVISGDLYANITDQERNIDLRLLTLQ